MEKILKEPHIKKNFKFYSNKLKIGTQKMGAALSGMIQPIIGVIIGWGLLTAFFIPTGWTPVQVINDFIIGNLITWLIPLLIGYLGGKQIYGEKGGFVGAAATAGIIAGALMFNTADNFWGVTRNLGPQFLGAMIAGPLSAFLFKKLESLYIHRIKAGFEMLVNNFSMGIYLFGFILVSFFLLPWISFGLSFILELIINPLTKYNLLPLTSLFVEPAKPLFLNNAINHGVFTPLGLLQVQETGKSILFYIESNPGPGLGILLAYVLMDKKERSSAASASIIHFFGGIHEVYFPFIIIRPILVLATMIGGAAGVAMLQIFNAGAVAPASPGSVIALFAVSANQPLDYAGLALSIIVATVVTFAVAVFLIRFTKKRDLSKNEQIAIINANKGKESKYLKKEDIKEIKNIIFACDAGMGSSAMGAGILRKLFKENNLEISVKNVAIKNLSEEKPDLIVVQKSLSQRAKKESSVEQFTVDNFLDNSQYKILIENIKQNNNKTKDQHPELLIREKELSSLLNTNNVLLFLKPVEYEKALKKSGEMLVKQNLVEKKYIESMIKRNKDVSVYVGNGVAIPHGQSNDESLIKNSGISFMSFPKGINWEGNKVFLVIGIAGKGKEHMDLIGMLGAKLSDEKIVQQLANAKTLEELKGILNE